MSTAILTQPATETTADDAERAEQEILIADHLLGLRFERVSPTCPGCKSVIVYSRETDIIAPELYRVGWRLCLVDDVEALHCPKCIAAYVQGQ